MNKILWVILIVLITIPSGVFSQENDGAEVRAYNQGDILLSAGLSLGYYGYGYSGTRSIGMIPLSASLEYGFHEYVSAGPYIGFASWKYRYSILSNNYNYTYRFVSVGGKGTFHYLPLLNEMMETSFDESKLDFYISLFLGLEFQGFSGDSNITGVSSSNNTYLRIGPFLGFRYMFNNNFGVFFEGGRNVFGYGTFGATLKL